MRTIDHLIAGQGGGGGGRTGDVFDPNTGRVQANGDAGYAGRSRPRGGRGSRPRSRPGRRRTRSAVRA